jgi:hypothetical protein
MTHVEEMLRTYPADLGDVDRASLVRCIDECFDCSQTWLALIAAVARPCNAKMRPLPGG